MFQNDQYRRDMLNELKEREENYWKPELEKARILEM